jgi:hypothetical protein
MTTVSSLNVVRCYADGLNGAVVVVAVVKNDGAITPLVHMSSWRGT